MSESKALAIVPTTFPEVQSMAEALAKSVLLPDALKNKPADLAFQIMTGRELGLGPMASIRGIHVIQGKPVLAADTIVALVLSSGLAEYFAEIESSSTSVTYETKRKSTPFPQRCTWTLDDAKRAGLYPTKDNWRLYPRAMLASRAKAELARSAYPDVIAGVYDADEIQVPVRPDAQIVDAEFSDVRDVVQLSPFAEARDRLIADIQATTTSDACKALLPRFGELPRDRAGAERAAAHDVYKAHLSKLTDAETTAKIEQTAVAS